MQHEDPLCSVYSCAIKSIFTSTAACFSFTPSFLVSALRRGSNKLACALLGGHVRVENSQISRFSFIRHFDARVARDIPRARKHSVSIGPRTRSRADAVGVAIVRKSCFHEASRIRSFDSCIPYIFIIRSYMQTLFCRLIRVQDIRDTYVCV